MYFQELPEPLFTYHMYSQFIDVISKSIILLCIYSCIRWLAKHAFMDLSGIHLVLVCFCCVELNQNEDQCVKLLLKLVDQLPAPNKSTLEVLMTHLCLYVLVYCHNYAYK